MNEDSVQTYDRKVITENVELVIRRGAREALLAYLISVPILFIATPLIVGFCVYFLFIDVTSDWAEALPGGFLIPLYNKLHETPQTRGLAVESFPGVVMVLSAVIIVLGSIAIFSSIVSLLSEIRKLKSHAMNFPDQTSVGSVVKYLTDPCYRIRIISVDVLAFAGTPAVDPLIRKVHPADKRSNVDEAGRAAKSLAIIGDQRGIAAIKKEIRRVKKGDIERFEINRVRDRNHEYFSENRTRLTESIRKGIEEYGAVLKAALKESKNKA